MKAPSILLVALAAGIAPGCAAPEVRVAPAQPALWHDTGTPPATIAQKRETRYYRDPDGVLWDDRGRKVSAGS